MNISVSALVIEYFHFGIPVPLTQDVSLNDANVDLTVSSIKYGGGANYGPTFNHSITLNSEYVIESIYTQNASILIPYPNSCDDFPYSYDGALEDHETPIEYNDFKTYLDDVEIPFSSISGEDLQSSILNITDDESQGAFWRNRLAMVNITITDQIHHILRIDKSIHISSDYDLFSMNLFVGSLRAWSGNFNATFCISIMNPENFIDVEFGYNGILSITNTDEQIVREGYLGSNNVSVDILGCCLYQYTGPQHDLLINWLIPGSIVVGTLTVVLCLWGFIRKK